MLLISCHLGGIGACWSKEILFYAHSCKQKKLVRSSKRREGANEWARKMIKLSFEFYFGHQLLNISRKLAICLWAFRMAEPALRHRTRNEKLSKPCKRIKQTLAVKLKWNSTEIHPYTSANGRASNFLSVSNANLGECVLWPIEQQKKCLCVKKKCLTAAAAAAAMKCKVFPSKKRERESEKEANLYTFGVGEAAQQLETNACAGLGSLCAFTENRSKVAHSLNLISKVFLFSLPSCK